MSIIDLDEVRARRRGPTSEAEDAAYAAACEAWERYCKRGGYVHRKPTRTASSVTLFPLGGSKVGLRFGSPHPFPAFGVPSKEEIEATDAKEREHWDRATEGKSFAEMMSVLADGLHGRSDGAALLRPTERENLIRLEAWERAHPGLATVKTSSAGGKPRVTFVNRDILVRAAKGRK